MSGGHNIRRDIDGNGASAEIVAGFVQSFPSLAALKAFASSAVTDGSKISAAFLEGTDEVVLSYKKADGSNVEDYPILLRADDHAATNTIYFLDEANCTINGLRAVWDADTTKLHLEIGAGAAGSVSVSIDQTGITIS